MRALIKVMVGIISISQYANNSIFFLYLSDMMTDGDETS
jgi:hypothetical protein